MLNYFGVMSMMPKNVESILASTFSIFLVGHFENYGESYKQDRSIIRINQDGTKDTSFNNQNKFARGSDIKLVRVSPTGDILVVSNSSATNYGGSSSWVHLINSNGDRINSSNIYNTFHVPTTIWQGGVNDITYDTNISSAHYGKIYIGFNGSGMTASGYTVSRIARYNSNWTLDTTFNTYLSSTQSGFNGPVIRIKILSDGNIIVGGNFTSYRGSTIASSTNRLCKLQPNGDLSTFSTGGAGFGTVDGSVIQVSDIEEDLSGNLYIGGSYTTFNSLTTLSNKYLVKLNSTGTKNNTFNNQFSHSSGSGNVSQVLLSNDGNLFVVFNELNHSFASTAYTKGITKISATTGLVVPSWNIPTFGLESHQNKILYDSISNTLFLYGRAISYNGYIRNGLIKLDGTTGQIDTSFSKSLRITDIKASPVQMPRDIVKDSNGKLIIVGNFNYFKSNSYSAVKISPNGTIDNSLDTHPLSGYPVNISIKDKYDNLFLGPIDLYGYEKINYLTGSTNNYSIIPNVGYATGLVKISSTGSHNETYVTRQSGGVILSMDIDNSKYQLYLGGSFLRQPNSNPGVNDLIRFCRVSATSGTVDSTFNTMYNSTYGGFRLNRTSSATTAADVYSVKYDPVIDKVYCGGDFGFYNTATASRIIRITSTGSNDPTFNTYQSSTQSGFNLGVRVIEVDRTGGPNDGKIYVGGNFTTYKGITQKYICRLHPNGSIDNTFNIGNGPNNSVTKIVILPNGSLFISGLFTDYNGISKSYVCKLNEDGSIDNTFDTGTGFQYVGLNDYTSSYSGTPQINNIKYDPVGKLYILGNFAMYRGVYKNGIVRLNMNGTIDTTFNDNGYGAQNTYINTVNFSGGPTDLVFV